MSTSIKGPLINALGAFTQVNGQADGRVYPDMIPQEKQLPAVTVEMTGKDRNQHLGGYDDSLIFEEFYIRVYSLSAAQADSIGDDIANTLEDIEETVISSDDESISRRLEAVLLQDETDDAVNFGGNSDKTIHIYQIEVQIQHSPGS